MTLANVKAELDSYVQSYVNNNPKSGDVSRKAVETLPSGTTRSVLLHSPYPLYLVGGRECYVTSADGDEYLDFVSEYCAGMFGHSHPDIIAAIQGVTSSGFTLGGPNTAETRLAELIVGRFPSLDRVRFCNSGTEANIGAVATALHFTGRKKIMVFNGAYHGGVFSFAHHDPAHPNPMTIPHEFVFGTYNDIEATRAALDESIGAIIIEPLQFAGGMIAANREFLLFLREETRKIGAVLIFDEVVTSRLSHGGLQDARHLDVTPDMTSLGKHFGGGFSFGAFGGRKEILDLFSPTSPKFMTQSGTWNNNLFSMSAGVVACGLLSHENLEEANRLGDSLREGITKLFSRQQPPLIHAVGYGSIMGLRFNHPDSDTLRDLVYFYLLENKIYIGHRGFLALNITHRQEHVDRVLKVFESFFAKYCLAGTKNTQSTQGLARI